MEPFRSISGVVAPLDRPNVDTDQIVPARYLKRIERQGWGEVLFYDWGHLPDGSPNPEFVLNVPAYRDARVLVTRRNFGSGSSREHAVWAIAQYGIRAIIAPSFADIFHKNCFENGVVPVILPDEQVNAIMQRALAAPGYRLTVNLEQCRVLDEEGLALPFVVHDDPGTHEFRRRALLNGLDEIAITLDHDAEIAGFESRRPRFLEPVNE